jgi:N-formylglutamate deformylase
VSGGQAMSEGLEPEYERVAERAAEQQGITVHGPRPPQAARHPLVLDSPHSGSRMPADFGAAVPVQTLRDAEDCFVDTLWQGAAERGIPLLAAQFPRTYVDVNRHADDIDPGLLDAPWPRPVVASGKGDSGKSLVWRTLLDGRAIYDRLLGVAEVQRRIDTCHRPYHATLRALLDAAHTRHGQVWHLNCHSMNATPGGPHDAFDAPPRADFVLGDRDGSCCDPAFTAFVARWLRQRGYTVAVNDPFKGVELVRAHADPAAGRHSLQVEINKRLYMDRLTLQPHAGFAALQADLMALLDATIDEFLPARRRDHAH